MKVNKETFPKGYSSFSKAKITAKMDGKAYQLSVLNVPASQVKNSANFPPESPAEVYQLVEELAKYQNVHRVRAVAPQATDIYEINFEIEVLSKEAFSEETWDVIRDLVIDKEWFLRDKTNQSWYFSVKLVEQFTPVDEEAKLLAVSDSEKKIQFSPRPKFHLVSSKSA